MVSELRRREPLARVKGLFINIERQRLVVAGPLIWCHHHRLIRLLELKQIDQKVHLFFIILLRNSGGFLVFGHVSEGILELIQEIANAFRLAWTRDFLAKVRQGSLATFGILPLLTVKALFWLEEPMSAIIEEKR